MLNSKNDQIFFIHYHHIIFDFVHNYHLTFEQNCDEPKEVPKEVEAAAEEKQKEAAVEEEQQDDDEEAEGDDGDNVTGRSKTNITL